MVVAELLAGRASGALLGHHVRAGAVGALLRWLATLCHRCLMHGLARARDVRRVLVSEPCLGRRQVVTLIRAQGRRRTSLDLLFTLLLRVLRRRGHVTYRRLRAVKRCLKFFRLLIARLALVLRHALLDILLLMILIGLHYIVLVLTSTASHLLLVSNRLLLLLQFIFGHYLREFRFATFRMFTWLLRLQTRLTQVDRARFLILLLLLGAVQVKSVRLLQLVLLLLKLLAIVVDQLHETALIRVVIIRLFRIVQIDETLVFLSLLLEFELLLK